MNSYQQAWGNFENNMLKEGVHYIEYIQERFKDFEGSMHLLNTLGSPTTSFFLIFPIAYYLCPRVGLLIAWSMCLSEWLNGILKWILHGERPYWWAVENRLPLLFQNLRQFPSTCETGPGSPSGHCMVTGATLYILAAYLCTNLSRMKSSVVTLTFFLIMTLIGVARCFIAAHFPHQVIAGIMAGVCIGLVIGQSRLSMAQSWEYIAAGLGVFLSALGVYRLVLGLGFNPHWSIILAQTNCQKKTWINLETSLFFAFSRDAALLIGVGVATWILNNRLYCPPDRLAHDKISLRFFGCFLSCLLSWALHSYRMPLPSNLYLLGSLNYAAIALVVMVIVPQCLGLTIAVTTDKSAPISKGQ